MFVDFNILNQLGSPSINSNTFANRPSAGQVGRLFVSTDTFEIYRDTGTGWDLIGGPGSSTVTGSGAAGQVTYWTGSNTVSGENNLWWDAANNHLGINTITPGAALDIHSAADVGMQLNGTGATPNIYIDFLQTGTSQYRLGYTDGAIDDRRFSIYDVTGAKEVLTIDKQSRYVGINYQYSSLADQPAYTLDVSGSLRITDSAYLGTNAGNRVGIGTTTPDRIFTVYSGTTDSRVLLQTQASGTGINSGFDLNIIYTSYGAYAQNDAQVWNYENAAMVFATNNTERLRIINTGTVSINETNPYTNAKLIIKQSSLYDGMFVNGSTSANNTIGLYHTGSIGAIESTYLSGGGVYTPITFWTSGLERLRINTNGNFLIGTTTDAGQKLQVSGVIYATTGLNINTTSTDSAQLKVNGSIGVNDYNQNTYLYVTGGVAGQRVSAFVGTYAASGSVTLATFSRVGGAVSADIRYDDSLSPLGISYGTTTNHALYFYTNNTTALLIKNDQTAEFTQSIKTAAPTTGTAAAWKLGQRVAAAVALDATQYIEVEVGGTFYKLAIVT